jgi:hypothetical protein
MHGNTDQSLSFNGRDFARNRIRSRFRDNLFELGARRREEVLRRGRNWLNILKKANLGDVKRVDKVLEYTYGRRGKRKHELLAVLAILFI